MLSHLVWLVYDLTHFYGLVSLLWMVMGGWAIWRVIHWHRPKGVPP